MDKRQAPHACNHLPGYTTGTCAAAAAGAALTALLGSPGAQITVRLPGGGHAALPVLESAVAEGAGRAAVKKQSVGDPDSTQGAIIRARVELRDDGRVLIQGGAGVGTVTLPGLAVAPGESAINPVPRRMIEQTVRVLLPAGSGATVTISVDRGEELARKTLNPRLGIEGGISILGTTGVVVPFSHDAYRESIACALDVARAAGSDTVVLSTGRSSEQAAMALLPQVLPEAFVLMADYFGWAVEGAVARGFQKIVCAFFPGKLLKAAGGAECTHCSSGAVDLEMLARVVADVLPQECLLRQVRGANTVRHAVGMLPPEAAHDVCAALAARVCARIQPAVAGSVQTSVLVFDYDGSLICRV